MLNNNLSPDIISQMSTNTNVVLLTTGQVAKVDFINDKKH